MEQFLKDLNSIRAGGVGHGGDNPEYGMSGIARAIKKTLRYPETKGVSYILLFTDAPAKDYYRENFVKRLLKHPDNHNEFDVVVHGFIPEYLLDDIDLSCYDTPEKERDCLLRSGIPYKEIVKENEGYLVGSITSPTAFHKFVSMFNDDTDSLLPPTTCNGRKKRLSSECQEFQVLTITQKVTVIVHPSSQVTIAVRDSVTNVRSQLDRNGGESAIMFWNNPKPIGTWSVCVSGTYEVDIKIENNFQFTIDFPLSTLPPPGCPVDVVLFTPQIGSLSCTETSTLEVVGSSSYQGNLECCGSHFRGKINLPTGSFSFNFHGHTTDGHYFVSEQVMRHEATKWTLLVSTVHAPSTVSKGSSEVYDFNVKTAIANDWPNCSLTIRINASTSLHGLDLQVQPNVVTLKGALSVSFRIVVTATEEAAPGRGHMDVAFSIDGDGSLVNSSRVPIGIEVCVMRNCKYIHDSLALPLHCFYRLRPVLALMEAHVWKLFAFAGFSQSAHAHLDLLEDSVKLVSSVSLQPSLERMAHLVIFILLRMLLKQYSLFVCSCLCSEAMPTWGDMLWLECM